MCCPILKRLCPLLLLPALSGAASVRVNGIDAEFLVNTGATSAAAPDVGATAEGAFEVSWQSISDAPAAFPQIAAKRYSTSGVALDDEFRVDSSTPQSLEPAIAINTTGQFIVTWWHFDGFEIQGRRHAADDGHSGHPSIFPACPANLWVSRMAQGPIATRPGCMTDPSPTATDWGYPSLAKHDTNGERGDHSHTQDSAESLV